MKKFTKKLTITILALITLCCSLLLSTSTTSAMDCKGIKDTKSYNDCMNKKGNYDSSKSNGAVFTGDCRNNFLGLTSWDCNVNISNEDTLKEGIWQIVVNIATDITVIASYLVLGYVIYAGYLYMFSSGESAKVAAGKKTLVHAFIGLAIVLSANLIMNSIRFALLGSSGKFNCDLGTGGDPSQCAQSYDVVLNVIGWVIGIAGIVAVIFVVYGGISYITSKGDPGKLQKAKDAILYALIGLAIVGLAEIITAFVSNMIRSANETNKQSINITNQQLIISKETHENTQTF